MVILIKSSCQNTNSPTHSGNHKSKQMRLYFAAQYIISGIQISNHQFGNQITDNNSQYSDTNQGKANPEKPVPKSAERELCTTYI